MENLYDFDGVVVRKSIPSDIENMELKQSDVDEIWASHNHRPLEALRLSIKVSTICFTIEDNGKPIAIFGINPSTIIDNKAVIWLLSTPMLKLRAYRFIKHSKKFIGMFLDFYPYLFNFVDDRNKESIDWLRRCGAVIDDPKPYGVEQKNFRYFYFTRN